MTEDNPSAADRTDEAGVMHGAAAGDGLWSRLRSLARKPRPWQVALAYSLFLWGVISVYTHHFDGNISGFICIGDRFITRSELPPRVFQIPNSVGYDGQFFYFIARDPLIRKGWHKHIDRPAYRYQRILYPALAGVSSLGREKWVPWALVFVNWAALSFGVWLMASYMVGHGRSAWNGAILGLFSGCLLGLYRDLCDPMAVVLLIASFVFFERRRIPAACALLAAALLTRETTAIAVPILVGQALWRRNFRDAAWILLTTVPFACWQVYVWARLGEPSWRGGTGNFGPPLVALVEYATRLLKAGGPAERLYFALFLAQAAACVPLALIDLWKRRDAMAAAFALFAVMPFFMSRFVWVEPWSYGRVLVSGPAFLLLAYGRGGGRVMWIPLAANLALTLLTLARVH